MILKIEETKEGISLIQEEGDGVTSFGTVNKFELVYRIVELLLEWLSAEKEIRNEL